MITLTAKNPQVPNFFSITDSKLARLFLDFFHTSVTFDAEATNTVSNRLDLVYKFRLG